MKKLLFIFNPISGKGLVKNKVYEIIDIFTKAGYASFVHPTQRAGEAIEKVQEFAPIVDLIVCSGGDGTLDEVITGLYKGKFSLPVGYIPAGSTNDFANSLSISKDPLQAAKDIVEGKVYHCDLGLFNGNPFVYVAAFGAFTEVSYNTNQDLKNALGHLAYILEGAKQLTNIPSFWLKASADGFSAEGEYIFGMVTNSKSVGGFKNLVGENVELDDGRFEVTLIRKPKNPLEWQEVLASLASLVDETDLIDTLKVEWLSIESAENIPWTLDGEFGGEHRFSRIDAIKGGISLIVNSN